MDEPKVAGSFDELRAAAKEEARKSEIELPWWKGLILRVGRASTQDHARLKRQMTEAATDGERLDENMLIAIAWICVCVREPKLTADQVRQLWDEAPADMSNLASICMNVSSGMPLTRIMLNTWGNMVVLLQKSVDDGEATPGVLHVWMNILRTYMYWLDTGGGLALNFRDLGKLLVGLDENADVQDAADAVKTWASQQDEDLGNALAEESSTSSASASSTPEEDQTNSPSPDGPSTTSDA
jgi:hypothetical protein